MKAQMTDPQFIRLSLNLYRLLLTTYPPAYRQEYSPHMLQAFTDFTRQTFQHKGFIGILWWWAIALFDFANSVTEEHLQRISGMTKEKFIRLGAWSLILAGIIMLVAFAYGSLYETSFGRNPLYETIQTVLWSGMALLYAIGLLAMRRQYQINNTAIGNNALLFGGILGLISFAGLLVSGLSNQDIGWAFFVLGILSLSLAMMLFGIDTLRSKAMSRWNALPFVTGVGFPILLIAQLVFNYDEQNNTMLDGLYMVDTFVLSLGLVGLGYLLMQEPQTT